MTDSVKNGLHLAHDEILQSQTSATLPGLARTQGRATRFLTTASRTTLCFALCVFPLSGALAQQAALKLDAGQRAAVVTRLTENEVSFTGDAGDETVSTSKLTTIAFEGSSISGQPTATVTLHDGSSIKASSLRTTGLQLAVKVGETVVAIPIRLVRAVNLGSLTNVEKEDWQKILDSEIAADVLAIRRPSGRLEKIEGIIREVKDDTLKFDFSGNQIDVPLNKLAGYRTFSADTEQEQAASVLLSDRFGGTWNCTKVTKAADSDQLSVTLTDSTVVELPIDIVSVIDFSLGRSISLTANDSSRVAVRMTRQASQLNWLEGPISASDFLSPHRTLFRKPDSTTVKEAIEFPQGGVVSCRVPAGYSTLAGTALLKRSGAVISPVNVQVLLDKKTVLEFDMDETKFSRGIDVDIVADQLLEIVVTPQGSMPVGSAILLIEPRLQK